MKDSARSENGTRDARLVRERRRSGLEALVIIALAAFGCELLFTALAYVAGFEGPVAAVADALVLVAILSPALYFLVYRPLDRDLRVMIESERALRETTEALQRLAVTDDLTGLYNRRGFFALAGKRLSAQRPGDPDLNLIFLDLDNLKSINDAHGHEMGDRALARCAQVLRGGLGDEAIIARVGGDEFAAVVAAADRDDAGETAMREIERRIDLENSASGLGFELSLSAGAVRCEPPGDANLDQLLMHADERMYRHKGLHRVGVSRGRVQPREAVGAAGE